MEFLDVIASKGQCCNFTSIVDTETGKVQPKKSLYFPLQKEYPSFKKCNKTNSLLLPDSSTDGHRPRRIYSTGLMGFSSYLLSHQAILRLYQPSDRHSTLFSHSASGEQQHIKHNNILNNKYNNSEKCF